MALEVTYVIDQAMLERLKNTFTYHAPREGQPERYQQIRQEGFLFASIICAETPPSREQSLALTKLEEVVFWANAAIARHEQ